MDEIIQGTLILLSIGSIVWWSTTFIDCIKRKFPKESEKLLWIVILLVGSILGVVLYYFLVQRKDKTQRA